MILEKLRWHKSVGSAHYEKDVFQPFFEWKYGRSGNSGVVIICELRAWPLLGIMSLIIFQNRNRSKLLWLKDASELRREFNQRGLKDPPRLEIILHDITECKKKSIPDNLEEIKDIFNELREKWEKLL